MSFDSVTKAIQSAIKINELHNCVITPDLEFKIGVSAGIPVTTNDKIFEDTIKRANYLSFIANEKICISHEVKELHESENRNDALNTEINSITVEGERFVTQLMEYTENVWTNSNTTVNDFHENLGYSKSKLYRTMMSIIGKSPNSFLKEYRLEQALQLLDKQNSNISEIAYNTGFNSPAYFSKCFQEIYGVLPSMYIKQISAK